MNKSKIILLFVASLLFNTLASAQTEKQNYKVALIGFYNLENLFDTINQPDVNDEDFTPAGANHYTAAVYKDKLGRLSDIISQLGTDDSPDGVALLGVAEIENRSVLEDLVKQPKIAERNYQIVHFESPDFRGIDVGLLYNPKYFKPRLSESLNVPLVDENGKPRPTRDVLWVYGVLDGEPVHIFVNHWPSRRGGEEASAPARSLAASVARHKIDSLVAINPKAKVILMGDLNDDPTSASLITVMRSTGERENMSVERMYNPWVSYYKKGIGTLAYNDSWNLFDQVIMTQGWLDTEQSGYFFQKAVIFSRPFMIQRSGRYKGYPFRTYDFSKYMGGYSDHFPVYVVLLKKAK